MLKAVLVILLMRDFLLKAMLVFIANLFVRDFLLKAEPVLFANLFLRDFLLKAVLVLIANLFVRDFLLKAELVLIADEEEAKRKEEWKNIAKKELDDWYKHHDEQLSKTKENNR